MFIFPAYIALVWLALWSLRRTWAGGGVLLLSLVGILGVWRVCEWAFDAQGWLTFVMPFYVLILAGGGAVIVLCSKVPKEFGCRRCGYDLAGLVAPVCPECGTRSHDPVPDARNKAPHRRDLQPAERPDLRTRVNEYVKNREQHPTPRSRPRPRR